MFLVEYTAILEIYQVLNKRIHLLRILTKCCGKSWISLIMTASACEWSLLALDTPGSEIALFPENIKSITSSVLKYTAKNRFACESITKIMHSHIRI